MTANSADVTTRLAAPTATFHVRNMKSRPGGRPSTGRRWGPAAALATIGAVAAIAIAIAAGAGLMVMPDRAPVTGPGAASPDRANTARRATPRAVPRA